MTEKEMVDQAMGVAWLVKKHGAEINILKAQLAERDQVILEQQARIRNLVPFAEVFENFSALEAALKSERIKTLEDTAVFYDYRATYMAAELRSMANELKEQS